MYSSRRDGQARDKLSIRKKVLRDFVFGTLRSSFGRSLALIVFLKCVFIRFRAHVETFHGFS